MEGVCYPCHSCILWVRDRTSVYESEWAVDSPESGRGPVPSIISPGFLFVLRPCSTGSHRVSRPDFVPRGPRSTLGPT